MGTYEAICNRKETILFIHACACVLRCGLMYPKLVSNSTYLFIHVCVCVCWGMVSCSPGWSPTTLCPLVYVCVFWTVVLHTPGWPSSPHVAEDEAELRLLTSFSDTLVVELHMWASKSTFRPVQRTSPGFHPQYTPSPGTCIKAEPEETALMGSIYQKFCVWICREPTVTQAVVGFLPIYLKIFSRSTFPLSRVEICKRIKTKRRIID